MAYGVFGYAGNYHNTSLSETDPQYFTYKSYYGIGAKVSANIYTPINDHVDFRVLGVEATYSTESGDYSKFRVAVKDLPNFHVYEKNNMLNVGLTSEVAWQGTHGSKIKHAIRGYLGTYIGPQAFIYLTLIEPLVSG